MTAAGSKTLKYDSLELNQILKKSKGSLPLQGRKNDKQLLKDHFFLSRFPRTKETQS